MELIYLHFTLHFDTNNTKVPRHCLHISVLGKAWQWVNIIISLPSPSWQQWQYYERIEYKLGVMVYRCLHDRHLGTSLITSSVFICDPLTWTIALFLAADLACTAVGLFVTLAQQSGTRCQMNLEIRTVLIVLNDSLKRYFSASSNQRLT